MPKHHSLMLQHWPLLLREEGLTDVFLLILPYTPDPPAHVLGTRHFENLTFQSRATLPPHHALFGGVLSVTASLPWSSTVLPQLKAIPAQPRTREHALVQENYTPNIKMY